MNIRDKILLLRQRDGLSQDTLAERLGVSRQSVSKWESGKAVPDTEKILLMSELFGVSTDCLLKDSIPLPKNCVQSDEASDSGGFSPDNDTSEELASNEVEDLSDEIEASSPATFENPAPVFASQDTSEFEIPEGFIHDDSEAESDNSQFAEYEKRNKRKMTRRIIAICVAACIVISALAAWPLGLYEKAADAITEEPIKYPYILVHGLGGWGAEAGINEAAPYWGAATGSLADYLGSEGYETFEATVGPFSSAWDRACELYAQLMGTKVDYGKAHSAAHEHERYGREYASPLFDGWGTKTPGGQLQKINLVGHSFGGPTIRLLAHLMEYGAPEEVSSTDKESISPLFTGGKGDYINSITALCSPNNGSTLFYVLDEYNLTSLLLKLCLTFAGISGNAGGSDYLDFHLEQFGITPAPGDKSTSTDMKDVFEKITSMGTDNAAYDLSPDGAAKLNERINTVDDIYYFSYSYSTTSESALTGTHTPNTGTMLILRPTAYLMGKYTENTVSDYPIDGSWAENDGLVNVVSARFPSDEEWQDFDSENIVKGKWNVMPTMEGDHGTVIGMHGDTETVHGFFDTLFKMTDALPRDKEHYYALPF